MSGTDSQERKLVPDTLDLAERGRLAINGLLGSLDPDCGFEPYFLTYMDVHPAYMIHWSTMLSGVATAYMEALPLLRLMSGSDQDRDLEDGLVNAFVTNMAEDGLLWERAVASRPWNSGVGYGVKGWNEDWASTGGNCRLLGAMGYWYQATGDETWLERAKSAGDRILDDLVVVKGDYAYFPNSGLGDDCSYPRSGWRHTDPPHSEQEGSEGAMTYYQLESLRGLARWYRTSGDERFLDLSRKFANFMLQPHWWGGLSDMEPAAGAERGHFWGHYHGRAGALRGLLEYAIIADDWRVKEFVRDGYEWARHHGIHRLGVFPGGNGGTEGCTVADMVGLAVRLTDAGVGDYWDDVDQYARNGLLEIQAVDQEEMERVSQAGLERPKNAPWGGEGEMRNRVGGVLPGQETTDRVIERSVGAYGHLVGARYLYPRLMHCCTSNGPQGLYYAWEGIVRYEGSDTAQVNLWQNRRSPWVDVWSWLPYEGRLAIRNKGMKRIIVRVPGWVRRGEIRCSLDGSDVQPICLGNRMLFTGLRGEEELRLETPVSVEKTAYTLGNLNNRSRKGPDRYDCEFKGNTVISVGEPEVHPGGHELVWYRLFRREHMRADEAPVKQMPEYVHPEKVVRW